MPPRKSRASVPFNESHHQKPHPSSGGGPTNTARKPKKAARRALDAFAIAAHEVPERTKIRRSRLGELEEGPGASSTRRKRNRDEDEDGEGDEDEEEQPKRRRRGGDDEGSDEGSDSEGNTWTVGQVGSEDDSDIDSDEAFGESDEERFEGWAFRGSSSAQDRGKGVKRKGKRRVEEEDVDMEGEIDLDEESSADGEEDEEEDDLGEDAIDLATALDQYEESEDEDVHDRKQKKDKKNKKKPSAFDDSEPSEEDDFAADGADDFSSSEDDDEDEADKTARLRDLIASLPAEEEGTGRISRKDAHESGTPSEFGVMRKVDLLSIKSKISDPEKRKSLRLLQDDLKPSKRNDIARKLDAPLPKRQQDKLDRAAANEKANEVLSRWVDTVKKNRRAEHLSFPLKSAFESESMGESRLMPTTATGPANELESTIQSILQQSGLSNGKDDEEQLQKWEELQTNKLPLEEVAKRRAQLRRERELLFREEVRAKRIKKIKSKSYRRVHRKERERLAEREREELKAQGVDVSEDEREYNDRRRAEERMGAKHRESRWAKSVKKTGRAAWDEDARASVNELARRNEELRRRIEGKEIRDEDEDRSDFTSDEEEDDDSEEDPKSLIQKQLKRLKEKNPFTTDESKLGNMMFMQKAEAARRQRNDEDIERMRRELAGEESHSEEEDENSAKTGRMKFGPTKAVTTAIQPVRGEFEEMAGSDDDEEEARVEAGTNPEERAELATTGLSNGSAKASATTSQAQAQHGPSGQNADLKTAVKSNSGKQPDALWKAHDTVSALQKKSKSKSKAKTAEDDDFPDAHYSAPDADGFQTVTYGKNSDNDDDDTGDEGINHNQALVSALYAGDNVEAEFEAEKAAQMDEEAEKTITTHLPGWGAWVGDGLTKNEKKNKGKKSVTKQEGVKISKRKDLTLEKVIINERKIKKNSKFLATQLPFPFETREQYERSLRVPQGKEWTTKMTFQEATKPRVLLKQGIITPMKKPMV